MHVATMAEVCSSCGVRLTENGRVHFNCPACGEGSIGRCVRCRDQGVHYRCRRCDFEGP
jgi:predicted RNA-binding Zn-ribbon protein involved in translation (DUF1610 family)